MVPVVATPHIHAFPLFLSEFFFLGLFEDNLCATLSKRLDNRNKRKCRKSKTEKNQREREKEAKSPLGATRRKKKDVKVIRRLSSVVRGGTHNAPVSIRYASRAAPQIHSLALFLLSSFLSLTLSHLFIVAPPCCPPVRYALPSPIPTETTDNFFFLSFFPSRRGGKKTRQGTKPPTIKKVRYKARSEEGVSLKQSGCKRG